MELKFEYGSRIITFNLIYRKRKTMSIEVETTGEVTVIAPVGTSTDDVIEKVKSRAGWIVSKQYESKFINDTKIEREAVSGESYMYLGRNYSLDIRVDEDTDNISVKLFQGKFVVNTYTKDEDLIKKAMENWYREKTLARVKERVSYYSSYFNDKVTTIKVKKKSSTTNKKTVTTKKVVTTKKKTVTTYTIKKGDTLWLIAKKCLGSGNKWKTVYNANKDIIEKTAKKHGKSSSANGRWLYVGTKLKITKG